MTHKGKLYLVREGSVVIINVTHRLQMQARPNGSTSPSSLSTSKAAGIQLPFFSLYPHEIYVDLLVCIIEFEQLFRW
jgi:hypothetical protein